VPSSHQQASSDFLLLDLFEKHGVHGVYHATFIDALAVAFLSPDAMRTAIFDWVLITIVARLPLGGKIAQRHSKRFVPQLLQHTQHFLSGYTSGLCISYVTTAQHSTSRHSIADMVSGRKMRPIRRIR
jgi:hypothetical protein